MSDDILSNPLVQEAFRRGRRALGVEKFYAVLGSADGKLSEGLPKNRIRVRKITSDGLYGREYIVTAWTHETTNYMTYVGVPVIVGYVLGELAVLGQYSVATEALNLNPSVLNTGNPVVQATPTTEILPLLCVAVGTVSTPSTKVGIKSFRYFNPDNTVGWYQGSVASQVDLASFIPTGGLHRFACLFFNTLNQSFTVRASTAKSMAIPLSDLDKQECFNAKPPNSIPVRMIRLKDGQTAITQADLDEDLRPLFGQGTSRQNYNATGAPTATDDTDIGYGIGSLWIDTANDNAYVCADNASGTAVWLQINGGGGGFDVTDGTNTEPVTTELRFDPADFEVTDDSGTPRIDFVGDVGMTDFTVNADSGTPQTISDGNTLLIEGSGGITTTVSNTDKVTIDGSAFMQSFDIVGGFGSPQVVNDGDTVAITNGAGIGTTISGSHIIKVNNKWDVEVVDLISSQAFDVDITLLDTYSAMVRTLEIEYSLRSTQSVTSAELLLYLNNDTTNSNYRRQTNSAQGGSVFTGQASDAILGFVPGASSDAGAFGTGRIILSNFNTSQHKTAYNTGVARLTGTTIRSENMGYVWLNSSGVQRIQIRTNGHPTNLFVGGSYIRIRFIN